MASMARGGKRPNAGRKPGLARAMTAPGQSRLDFDALADGPPLPPPDSVPDAAGGERSPPRPRPKRRVRVRANTPVSLGTSTGSKTPLEARVHWAQELRNTPKPLRKAVLERAMAATGKHAQSV